MPLVHFNPILRLRFFGINYSLHFSGVAVAVPLTSRRAANPISRPSSGANLELKDKTFEMPR